MKFYTNAGYGTSDTNLQFQSLVTPKIVNIGDLLVVSKSLMLSSEILQILPPIGNQQYFPYSSYNHTTYYTDFSLQIKRGYNGTVKDTANQYSKVYRIVPTKVYSLEGNFAQSLTQGKMRVNGTKDIIYLDNSGVIVSGSSLVYI
jgi:hypothetical protein